MHKIPKFGQNSGIILRIIHELKIFKREKVIKKSLCIQCGVTGVSPGTHLIVKGSGTLTV